MAVVQISKIQVRRGKKNQGAGIPQLSGGEFGWAVDSRELYIGNGSVAEGAPAVGNTKVITEHDDIFALVDTYKYKSTTDYMQTGVSTTSPVARTLQDRLDDIVSVKSFDCTGEATQDCTEELQRALDQLYLNSANKGTEVSRVVLHMEPGVYTINGTVYVPPYATILGAGPDKTVIKTSSTSPVFKTQNDLDIGGSKTDANDDSGTAYNNQARNILISGVTLQTTAADGKGLVLQNCRNSIFENIKIKGPWVIGQTIPTDYQSDIGIEINSKSGSVGSGYNQFINCYVEGWAYGVLSNWDITYCNFDTCTFDQLGQGINFGSDMVLGAASTGQSIGPNHCTIHTSQFQNIEQQAILITNGLYNLSLNNRYVAVGNNGGTESQPVHSVIKFLKASNTSNQDYFKRTEELSYKQANLVNVVYVPEVEGPTNWAWGYEHKLNLTNAPTAVRLMRLPKGDVDNSFDIDYTINSTTYEISRTGKLTIVVNGRNGRVELFDDYQYSGTESYLDKIYFDAILSDEDGDTEDETVVINYINTTAADDVSEFKFTVRNKQTSIS